MRNIHSPRRAGFTDFGARQELELADLRRIVPAAFAEEAHDSRSERYRFIPSAFVLEGLYKEGFRAVWAGQGRVRDVSRVDFTRHNIRLRHPDMRPSKVGDVFPEIGFQNGHDGTSAFQLNVAFYRLWCMNGCSTSVGEFDRVHVRHSGNMERIRDQVVEGAFRVMSDAPRLLDTVDRWAGIEVSPQEQVAFTRAALIAANPTVDPDAAPELVRQTNRARRSEDHGADIWRTFNRVQENIMRGGTRAFDIAANRTRTMRPVQSIDRHNRVNAALFELTSAFATLKTGSADDIAALQARAAEMRNREEIDDAVMA